MLLLSQVTGNYVNWTCPSCGTIHNNLWTADELERQEEKNWDGLCLECEEEWCAFIL